MIGGHCGCGCHLPKGVKWQVEESKDSLLVKITAKDKSQLEALKHLVKAHQTLCGC